MSASNKSLYGEILALDFIHMACLCTSSGHFNDDQPRSVDDRLHENGNNDGVFSGWDIHGDACNGIFLCENMVRVAFDV